MAACLALSGGACRGDSHSFDDAGPLDDSAASDGSDRIDPTLEEGPEWVFHGQGPFDRDEADGVAVDAEGNVFAAGIFGDTVQLGEERLTSRGRGDIFILKLRPDGTIAWLRHFGAEGDDNAFDAAVDSMGNVICNGWFSGTVSFGATELRARGASDQFVVKLNPEGEVQWAQSMGSELPDGGNELAIDSDDNIVLSAISVGPYEAQGQAFSNLGARDSYVVSLDPSGRLRWARGFGGAGNDRIRAIAVDGNGDVWAGFEFEGEIRVDDSTRVSSRGDWDGLAVHLGRDHGETMRHWHLGGPGFDNVRAIGGDRLGRGYVHGVFSGEMELAGQRLRAVGQRDSWFASLSAEGGVRWVATLGGPEDVDGGELVALPDGRTYLSLDVRGSMHFVSPDLETHPFDAGGAFSDALIMRLSPEGFLESSWMPDTAEFAFGNTLGVSPDRRRVAVDVLVRQSVTIDGRSFATTGPTDKDFLIVSFSSCCDSGR